MTAWIKRNFHSLVEGLYRIWVSPISCGNLRALAALLRFSGVLVEPEVNSDGVVRRILISYPYCNLGDLILMMPMIEAIHRQWPEAAIEVVVNARTAELLQHVPYVECVYRADYRPSRIPGLTNYKLIYKVLALYRAEMMQKRYDLAITPRWGEDLRYGNYYVYLTGAPMRCGYSAGVDGRNLAWDRFLTHIATGGEHEHEALRDLRLLSRTALYEETAEDQRLVERPIALLQQIAASAWQMAGNEFSELAAQPHVVLSPGGTHPRRLWPLSCLAALMQQLELPADTRFLLIGSEDDVPRCEELVRQFPDRVISLAGKTNLMQMLALIDSAVLFVGNDSGPAHIAGALGVPTVVISPFALSCNEEHVNSPVRFRPCGPRVSVVQPRYPMPPCFPTCSSEESHCIMQISVAEVLAAANSLMNTALPAATDGNIAGSASGRRELS